jgi:hypothetical protein
MANGMADKGFCVVCALTDQGRSSIPARELKGRSASSVLFCLFGQVSPVKILTPFGSGFSLLRLIKRRPDTWFQVIRAGTNMKG